MERQLAEEKQHAPRNVMVPGGEECELTSLRTILTKVPLRVSDREETEAAD